MGIFSKIKKTAPTTEATNTTNAAGIPAIPGMPGAPEPMGIPTATISSSPTASPQDAALSHAFLSEMALNTISDGVVILNNLNQIELLNPAAVTMLGYVPEGIIGLDVAVIFHFETSQGLAIEEHNNQFLLAVRKNTPFETREYVLISGQNQKHPISITVTPVQQDNKKIITFRDISKELEEEGAQAEFISTASHEMRTPVASIEGYLGLALNPTCATIDDRARKYLEEAHASSQHLGRLFQDLLDITKLDDKKLRVHPIPLELTGFIRKIIDAQIPAFKEKNLHFTFGSNSNMGDSAGGHMVDQDVYASVDVDFLREIMDNLIENAIKYNSEGGGIWINVRGDGDRVLINVTDTGIGISPDDLKHIFQKFYRADNSQTRTIGGTGLGLYLVRERVEAMGGKVWAESSFGEGSTFYVSLPRLTFEEYERRRALMNLNVPETPPAAPPTLVEQANVVPAEPGVFTLQYGPPAPSADFVQNMATAQAPQPAQPTQPAQPAQPTELTQPIPPVQPIQPVQSAPVPMPPQPQIQPQPIAPQPYSAPPTPQNIGNPSLTT